MENLVVSRRTPAFFLFFFCPTKPEVAGSRSHLASHTSSLWLPLTFLDADVVTHAGAGDALSCHYCPQILICCVHAALCSDAPQPLMWW